MPGTRSRVLVFGLAGAAFLFLFFLGSLKLVQYTESTPFCSSCHTMTPEVTVYRNSPHARTDCGTCHIGPGAWPVVQAKLENIRYLWVYPFNLYKRPIESPVHNLRPAEVVCEQCHWPQKFYEDRLVTLPRYQSDEVNSLTRISLLMKTGGGAGAQGNGRGIHWHIDNPVYYIATDDKRQQIPWVQATYNGVTTTYVAAGANLSQEQIDKAEKRRMDCIDCHNRATHVFQQPSDALDDAMARGVIPADLPYVKVQGLALLSNTYATAEAGRAAVNGLADFYRTKYPDVYKAREQDIQTAVRGLQNLLETTQFPNMQANWDTHPNNIGHDDSPGCFRCHDGKHLSADKQAIRIECNLCHSLPQVAGPGQPVPAIQFASAKEPQSHLSTTWLAQHRYQFDATCSTCHTTENPGGWDDSSFCSNSACHATPWPYAGLNAPEVRSLSATSRQPGQGIGIPAVPHPITQRTDCQICHGATKVRPAPANHASYTRDTCTGCHKPTLQEVAQSPAP